MSKIREMKRKRAQLYRKVFLLLIIIIISIITINGTMARYSSSGEAESNVDIAFYLLKEQTISQEIVLDNIEPSNNVYTYNFSVANYDEANRTEVALEYTIEIKVTTNLPLTYKLYVNDGTEDLFENYETLQDEYGTYFKKIVSSKNIFGFTQNEKNSYRLEISFPMEYNSIEYQGIAEALEIKINAEQKI